MGHFLSRSQRALCGLIHSVRWALFVVAFVEKAKSEVYTGHENSERARPVGGGIVDHTISGFPPGLPSGAGAALPSPPPAPTPTPPNRVSVADSKV